MYCLHQQLRREGHEDGGDDEERAGRAEGEMQLLSGELRILIVIIETVIVNSSSNSNNTNDNNSNHSNSNNRMLLLLLLALLFLERLPVGAELYITSHYNVLYNIIVYYSTCVILYYVIIYIILHLISWRACGCRAGTQCRPRRR